MALTFFEFVKPIWLFTTEWNAPDLVNLGEEYEPGSGDFVEIIWKHIPPGRFIKLEKVLDTYTTRWCSIPETSWNHSLTEDACRRIARADVAHLRFSVTVINGTPGDGIIFLFNDPNHSCDPEAEIHAAMYIDIIADPNPPIFAARQSGAVSQLFIPGYSQIIGTNTDPEGVVANMRKRTLVCFAGISKPNEIKLKVKCDFLGGFTSETLLIPEP